MEQSLTTQTVARPLSIREKYKEGIEKKQRESRSLYLAGFGLLLLFILLLRSLWIWEVPFLGVFLAFILGGALVLLMFGAGFMEEETAKKWEKRGWDINCGCGRHIAADTVWVCGRCDSVNDPAKSSADRLPHFLYQCFKCRLVPTALICPECKVAIQLGPEPIFRPARVYVPPDPKTAAMEKMEQQFKEEKVRLEIEAERDKLARKYRTQHLLLDLEELFDRIQNAKQFEREANKKVKELKAQGYLKPQEEAKIRELIDDKVLEFIHVDRRGGRPRHHPE